MRHEEWDWPPRRRYYARVAISYEPQRRSFASKVIDIYWRTVITVIKVLIAVPLAIVAIGAWWLFFVIVAVALREYVR